jgi:hypothetical protein
MQKLTYGRFGAVRARSAHAALKELEEEYEVIKKP